MTWSSNITPFHLMWTYALVSKKSISLMSSFSLHFFLTPLLRPSLSLSLSFPFLFFPLEGKLVWCNVADLLGGEISHGPSAVIGLEQTLSAPNRIWRLAHRRFLAPAPPFRTFPPPTFFPSRGVLWKARRSTESPTSSRTERSGHSSKLLLTIMHARCTFSSSDHLWILHTARQCVFFL